MHIPEGAPDFFEEFFPEQFALHRHALGVGTTSSAVNFVIEDDGAWSFHVRDAQLVVARGSHPDARLQLLFTRDDFEAIAIRRARNEVATRGTVSPRSLGPFRLLFSLEKKRDWSEREAGNSLLFAIDDAGVRRKMHLVPGAGPVPERARTVLHLKLADFLSLLNKESSGVAMLMSGRLRVSGDMTYALRANSLLA